MNVSYFGRSSGLYTALDMFLCSKRAPLLWYLTRVVKGDTLERTNSFANFLNMLKV